MSGVDAATIEPRLRALVRRELLVQQVDPRSPERGQYAFVQALIREVAYNTLAKRDRKVRHLAAARFFESLDTEELAGALAGHYLAAHGYATEGAEADALAAQARVALRGAAERAAALGAHTQAIAFLEHALAVSPDAADRADLHERALASAMQGLSGDVAKRHGLDALEARRELGDREEIALATAAYAQAVAFFGTDAKPLLEILQPAWEEFADLEETRSGVALMLQLATAHNFAQDNRTALDWLDRLLPVAERLDLLEETATALARRAGTLYRLDRPRESMIVLRGTHELAVANGLGDVDRSTRTNLTFREQFADPAAGLALAREGLEFARRRGSANFGFMMVGNAVSCAIRTGEWPWAAELLGEWLANEITGAFYLELFVDRAVLKSLRGEDPTVDLAEAERLVVEFMGRSAVPLVRALGPGLGCVHRRPARGGTAGGHERGRHHDLLRADQPAARSPRRPVGRRWSRGRGHGRPARELDHPGPGVRARHRHPPRRRWPRSRAAGPRRSPAIARRSAAGVGSGWRSTRRWPRSTWSSCSPRPSARWPTRAAAIESARETLTRLGAMPMLARLDAVRAAGSSPTPASSSAPGSTAPVGAPAEVVADR